MEYFLSICGRVGANAMKRRSAPQMNPRIPFSTRVATGFETAHPEELLIICAIKARGIFLVYLIVSFSLNFEQKKQYVFNLVCN